MVRARPVAYASAQRPLRTSYLIGLWRPQVGAIIQLPWAMVVMQPWLRERRLSVGAAARGQYYLSDVNFGAPPPLGPHFPRPIRPEPPSSPSQLRPDDLVPVGEIAARTFSPHFPDQLEELLSWGNGDLSATMAAERASALLDIIRKQTEELAVAKAENNYLKWQESLRAEVTA